MSILSRILTEYQQALSFFYSLLIRHDRLTVEWHL